RPGRCAVAVCRLPDDARRAQLVFWRALHGLQHPSRVGLRALRVRACGRTPGVLARHGHRHARDLPDDVDRPGRRPRDAARPPMIPRRRALLICPERATRVQWTQGLCLILLVVLSSTGMAHVGSPDVFLDRMAGPYRLLVTVRPPPVIPGVADVEILTSDP